ncbi:hypothetical protein ACT3UJ_15940 [Halomonas sp. 86]
MDFPISSLENSTRPSAPLNEPDHATFYGGDEKGYTDYPFMDNGYDRIG